jgi:hypothetical protein
LTRRSLKTAFEILYDGKSHHMLEVFQHKKKLAHLAVRTAQNALFATTFYSP